VTSLDASIEVQPDPCVNIPDSLIQKCQAGRILGQTQQKICLVSQQLNREGGRLEKAAPWMVPMRPVKVTGGWPVATFHNSVLRSVDYGATESCENEPELFFTDV
jgi:hypothetical protein